VVHLERPPAAIVVEGVRRKYTPERIARLAGSSRLTPVRNTAADEGRLAGADLSGRDWRIIDAMDGRRTVEELAEALQAAPHQVWSLAWALYSLELVSLPHADEAGAAPEESPAGPAGQQFELDVKRLLDRHALAREGDYFACLGAAPDATAHEIEQAYRQARRRLASPPLHPHVAQRYGAELDEVRAVLDEAYSVLSDERLRQRYRRHRLG
jgi:hypothetical protein